MRAAESDAHDASLTERAAVTQRFTADASTRRAYLACRAGFAGRGTPAARTTGVPSSGPPPTRNVFRVGLYRWSADATCIAASRAWSRLRVTGSGFSRTVFVSAALIEH